MQIGRFSCRDLRQGICSECRAADAIGIAPDEAAHRPPDKAAISHAFIREETVRELLRLLPEQLTTDLDIGALRKLPGSCVDLGQDVREIWVDSSWSVDYLPGRRKRSGTPVLMIEMLSHPYPRVASRLRRYASTLSASLCRSGSVEEEPPLILPVLLYNGLPAWTPRSFDRGWNRFEYTFVDVRRLPPEAGGARGLIAALSCPETAARIVDPEVAPGLALDVVR